MAQWEKKECTAAFLLPSEGMRHCVRSGKRVSEKYCLGSWVRSLLQAASSTQSSSMWDDHHLLLIFVFSLLCMWLPAWTFSMLGQRLAWEQKHYSVIIQADLEPTTTTYYRPLHGILTHSTSIFDHQLSGGLHTLDTFSSKAFQGKEDIVLFPWCTPFWWIQFVLDGSSILQKKGASWSNYLIWSLLYRRRL